MSMSGRPQPTAIGNIFDRQAFTDLSGMETGGGFTVSGGKVSVAAGSSYLQLDTGTCLDRFKVESTYEILTVDNANMGPQVGQHSINASADASVYAVFIDNGANAGKVAVYYKSGSLFFYSATALSFSTGDTVTVSLEKTRTAYIATATIGGVSVSKTYTITYNADTQVLNNTSKAAFIQSAGTYEIHSFTYSSLDLKNIDRLCIGDSISWGAWCQAVGNRYGQIACDGISAGPSDRIDEVLLHADEIINVINPAKVFIMIGTNSTSNHIAKCQTFDLAMTDAGIECIWVAPPSPTNLVAALESAFPSRVIDCYTPTNSGGSLNAAYNSGDGIHLNAAGNSIMASTIMASPLY